MRARTASNLASVAQGAGRGRPGARTARGVARLVPATRRPCRRRPGRCVTRATSRASNTTTRWPSPCTCSHWRRSSGLGDSWSAGTPAHRSRQSGARRSARSARGVDHFKQALEAFQQLGGHKRGLARVLDGLAVAASLDGRRAAAPYDWPGRLHALRDVIGTALTPTEQRPGGGRARIGQRPPGSAPAERSEAWVEGWAMTGRAGARAYGTGGEDGPASA